MKAKRILSVFLLSSLLAFGACGGDAVSTSSEETAEDTGYHHVSVAVDLSYPAVVTESLEIADGVYSVADFSVSLPDGFVQRSVNGFALFASEGEETVLALKLDSVYDLYIAGENVNATAAEYAERVAEKEGISATVTNMGDKAAFEYVRNVENVPYCYYVYAYKGSNAYYLLQFSCSADSAEDKASVLKAIIESVQVT